MIFEIKQKSLRNKYILTVHAGRAHLESSCAGALSFSCVFGDAGALCQAQLESLSNRNASQAEIMACMDKHVRRFISGPKEGEADYTITPADPVIARDKIAEIKQIFATTPGWLEFSENYDPNEMLNRIAAIVGGAH